jgi:hypothetical protein
MLLGSTMGLLEGLSEFSWFENWLGMWADRVIQLPRLFSRVWHLTGEVVVKRLSFYVLRTIPSIQQMAYRYVSQSPCDTLIADLFVPLGPLGGLRPHFLDVCKPDFSRQQGMGFEGYMYTREVCTGYVRDVVGSVYSVLIRLLD